MINLNVAAALVFFVCLHFKFIFFSFFLLFLSFIFVSSIFVSSSFIFVIIIYLCRKFLRFGCVFVLSCTQRKLSCVWMSYGILHVGFFFQLILTCVIHEKLCVGFFFASHFNRFLAETNNQQHQNVEEKTSK